VFPATTQILDDFSRADGGVGANWFNAIGNPGLTISGRKAFGATSGGSSAWGVPMATGTAAWCRVAALPTSVYIRLLLTPDPVGIVPRITATYDNTGKLGLTSFPGGGNTTSIALSPGDWFGVSYDGSLTITGWTAIAGGGFNSSLTRSVGFAGAPSGFYAILDIADDVGAVSAFGASILPGPRLEGAGPFEHGRGAC